MTDREAWAAIWEHAPSVLTPLQLEHLRLWAAGHSLRDAALAAGVATATVREHRDAITRRLSTVLEGAPDGT